ncbi:hypothetical protein MRB53_041788 [Persea americana]|nr:hypothetical protein MRB53_041788 [Persea americana]
MPLGWISPCSVSAAVSGYRTTLSMCARTSSGGMRTYSTTQTTSFGSHRCHFFVEELGFNGCELGIIEGHGVQGVTLALVGGILVLLVSVKRFKRYSCVEGHTYVWSRCRVNTYVLTALVLITGSMLGALGAVAGAVDEITSPRRMLDESLVIAVRSSLSRIGQRVDQYQRLGNSCSDCTDTTDYSGLDRPVVASRGSNILQQCCITRILPQQRKLSVSTSIDDSTAIHVDTSASAAAAIKQKRSSVAEPGTWPSFTASTFAGRTLRPRRAHSSLLRHLRSRRQAIPTHKSGIVKHNGIAITQTSRPHLSLGRTRPYNPNAYVDYQASNLNYPQQLSGSQPLTSATYIPHGEILGPEVAVQSPTIATRQPFTRSQPDLKMSARRDEPQRPPPQPRQTETAEQQHGRGEVRTGTQMTQIASANALQKAMLRAAPQPMLAGRRTVQQFQDRRRMAKLEGIGQWKRCSNILTAMDSTTSGRNHSGTLISKARNSLSSVAGMVTRATLA